MRGIVACSEAEETELEERTKAGIQGRERTSDDEGVLCGWTDVHQGGQQHYQRRAASRIWYGKGKAMWGYRCAYRSVGPEVLPS